MLNIPNLSKDIQVDSPFQFTLDPFQKYAIQAITNDENVLVTAKTGSGKTFTMFGPHWDDNLNNYK